MNARSFAHWLAGALLMMILFFGYHPVSAKSPVGTSVSQHPVVQAVMFWKAGRGHCDETINRTLPPIREKYGMHFHLQLVEIASKQDMDALYALAAVYEIPKENVGVPFLVLDETVLVGSDRICEQLPSSTLFDQNRNLHQSGTVVCLKFLL